MATNVVMTAVVESLRPRLRPSNTESMDSARMKIRERTNPALVAKWSTSASGFSPALRTSPAAASDSTICFPLAATLLLSSELSMAMLTCPGVCLSLVEELGLPCGRNLSTGVLSQQRGHTTCSSNTHRRSSGSVA